MTPTLSTERGGAALVTAVITTHRRPALLRRALASLQADRWPCLEIIVAEDGLQLTEADLLLAVAGGERGLVESADVAPPTISTADSAFDALSSGRHVRLVQAPVGGCAAARNLGLAHASGEFIIFLDDDDTVRPNRITDLVATIGDGGAIAYGRTAKHRFSGGEALIPAWPQFDQAVGFADLLVHMPHVDSVLMRTAALRSVGGFDISTPNFDEFSAWLRIMDAGGTAAFRDVIVADWVMHEDGLSGAMQRESTMGPSLVRLLAAVEEFARPEHAALAGRIRKRLELVPVVGFEDYVAVASRGVEE